MKILTNKKPILFILVATGLLVGTALLVKEYRVNTSNLVCSNKILEQATPNLTQTKNQQLKPVAENIKKLKSFDHDPNCLYVLVTYYTNAGDAVAARRYLDALKKAYDPGRGFSKSLGSNLKPIVDLEYNIKVLEDRAKQIKNNILFAPNL